MLTKNIRFKNFLSKFKNNKVKKNFKRAIKRELGILETLKPTYKYSYSKKSNFKK